MMATPTLEFCVNNPYKLTPQVIRYHYSDFYKYLQQTYPGLRCAEQLYRYFYGGPGICECGNETKFLSFAKGYQQYCCAKCAGNSKSTKEKRCSTNLSRYGVEFATQTQISKEKTKQTCLKKYGRLYALDIEKQKQTKQERYGDPNYNNRERAEKTWLRLYGVNNPSKLENVKEKIKETNLRKYGVSNPAQTPNIKEQIKKTKQERYGDPNYTNYEQIKKTKQERYGDPNYNNYEQIKKTKQERYGDPNYNNRESARKTCLKKYGVISPMQLLSVQQKTTNTCVEKYGVPYGILNTEPGYSKSSQEYFDSLKAEHPNAVYATNGDEHKVGPYLLDWYDPDTNTAIEFNGDYWHANPKFYEPDWIHPVKKCSAKEIWDKDIEKMEYLMEQGIDVKVVWKSEIKKGAD